jgi:hypothetical protein
MMQRTTEGASGSHSLTREQAEPFAIRTLRETFESYPPAEQEKIRERVKQQLRDEAKHREFAGRVANNAGKRPGSALARFALAVYGITAEDL